MKNTTRCVLLFARSPRQEALAKGLGREAALFEFARTRVAAAVASLDAVDLFVPGQSGRTFVERLTHAFRAARALGYRQIVAVPTDAPALGAGELADAFDALQSHEVVVGPSPDGGVYLIGMGGRNRDEDRLGEVRWLTSTVAADLLRCFPAAAVLNRVIADVDSRADLSRLGHDTALDPELAALLFFLRASSSTRSRETTIPPLNPPGRKSSGRAPPALLSLI